MVTPSQPLGMNLNLGTDILQAILGIVSAIKVKALMAGDKFDNFKIRRICTQDLEATQGKQVSRRLGGRPLAKQYPVPSLSSICLSRMYLMSASISGMINLQVRSHQPDGGSGWTPSPPDCKFTVCRLKFFDDIRWRTY
jgi:hypothetical protein